MPVRGVSSQWMVCTMDHCDEVFLFQSVEKVARYIQQQNREVYLERGIVIGDPMDRGLRCVS